MVTAFLLILGIVATPDYAWIAYPLLWTLVGILTAFTRVSMWRLGREAVLALPFALAAVTLLFTTPGQPILNAGGIVITDTGLGKFIGIMLKSWLSLHVALLLSYTTRFNDIVAALRGLGVSEILVSILNFMVRYLFTLKDEAETLLRARAARSGANAGVKAGGSLLWRTQVTGGMVGNLFLRSYERSERVYAAMLARGYNDKFQPQPLPPLAWQAVCMGILPLVAVVIIQIAARL